MDVERIQKVNNLAINLMNQGLACSREEAIAQAEKIFRNNDTADYQELKQTMDEVQSETRINQTPDRNQREELSQEDIKSILEKNTNFIVRTIREFQEKISAMEKEIYYLRSKVNYREPVIREVTNHVPPPQHTETQKSPNIEQITPKTETSTQNNNHPRSGGYKDDDVSIEKIFYMGNQ